MVMLNLTESDAPRTCIYVFPQLLSISVNKACVPSTGLRAASNEQWTRLGVLPCMQHNNEVYLLEFFQLG